MTGTGEVRRGVLVPDRFNQGAVRITAGTIDPSAVSTKEKIGSLYLNRKTGQVFKKVGVGNTDWEELGAGAAALSSFLFYADQLDNPNNADWAVNALAPAEADDNNNALTVRAFDDSAEEGVGFILTVPATATSITITTKGRARTSPGGVVAVELNLYTRDIPDNGAVAAFSVAFALTPISTPANEFFQYDTETLTLASIGVTPGNLTQFEFTRDGAEAGDTLVGDWLLVELGVQFV